MSNGFMRYDLIRIVRVAAGTSALAQVGTILALASIGQPTAVATSAVALVGALALWRGRTAGALLIPGASVAVGAAIVVGLAPVWALGPTLIATLAAAVVIRACIYVHPRTGMIALAGSLLLGGSSAALVALAPGSGCHGGVRSLRPTNVAIEEARPTTPALCGGIASPSFTIDVTIPALSRVGEETTAEVVVKPKQGHSINAAYPARLLFDIEPDGVELHSRRTGASDMHLSRRELRAPVRFTPLDPGETRFAGELRFSVCNRSTCSMPRETIQFETVTAGGSSGRVP